MPEKLQKIIKELGITSSVRLNGSECWRVGLRLALQGGSARRQTFIYYGPTEPATLEAVKTFLAATEATETFEKFCEHRGLDEDSRKAFKAWRTAKALYDSLIQFLGHTNYQRLQKAEK